MTDINLDWRGEALLYKGGLIIRSFHYRFDEDGRIKAVTPVTRPILQMLVEEHPAYKKNPGMAMATYLSKGGPKAEKPQADTKKKEEGDK